MDLLKSVDIWFLIFLVLIMAGALGGMVKYIIWSLQQMLTDLNKSINELKETIKELFDHRNDHALRIARLEERCAIKGGECCER